MPARRADSCDVPTYDYQCRQCGTTYEVIHSMLEDGPTACERCGGQLRRVLYPSGIIFKGSGFYKTDSRSSSGSSHRRSGTSSAAPARESSDGAAPSSEAKSGETKSGDAKSGEEKPGEAKSGEAKSGSSGGSTGARTSAD